MPGSLWEEFWFLFDGPTAIYLQNAGFLNPNSPVTTMGKERDFRALFERAQYFATKERPEKAAGVLLQILNEVASAEGVGPRPSSREAAIRETTDQVEKDPGRSWDFKGIARKGGMSYALFRKRFVEAKGLPPYQFLLRAKIKKAGALLSQGLSVKEVASGVGMADPYHFSRLFKSVTGKAPRFFAQSIRAWNRDHSLPA